MEEFIRLKLPIECTTFPAYSSAIGVFQGYRKVIGITPAQFFIGVKLTQRHSYLKERINPA